MGTEARVLVNLLDSRGADGQIINGGRIIRCPEHVLRWVQSGHQCFREVQVFPCTRDNGKPYCFGPIRLCKGIVVRRPFWQGIISHTCQI